MIKSTSPLAPLADGRALSAKTAGASDRLYRRTFVGLQSELKQLEAAFDAALWGHTMKRW